jgi:hypothetical protein
MRNCLKSLGLLVLLLGALPPLAISGQQQEGVKSPVPHHHIVSTNPFILLGSWLNIEYERKVATAASVGAMVSHLGLEGDDEEDVGFTGLSTFFRLYPQGAALNGFYLEGRGGLFHVAGEDESSQAFTLGIHIGYSWLFGVNRRFYISAGVGADRFFGGDLQGASPTLPSFRLVKIGVAF